MPNPVAAFIDKKFGPHLWPRFRQEMIGLAQDFWKDGTENPLHQLSRFRPFTYFSHKDEAFALNGMQTVSPSALWHPAPGDIAEIMWGEGFLLPGGAALFERLVDSLALNDKAQVLNLSAGLGGGLSALAVRGAFVDSFESTPNLANRCQAQSVTPFDPAGFKAEKPYDAILARDFFHRLPNQATFFAMLGQALKPAGRIAFTDYIVNPEHRAEAALATWRQAPGIVDMAEGWAKAGIRLDITEDLTAQHKQDLMQGLKKLAVHLAQHRPDGATKRQLARELNTLTQTAFALDNGLKFFRFGGGRM